MIYNNIIERRIVNNGQHSLVLEISKDDYNNSYNAYSNEIAYQIVNHHLDNRGDDGRPSDVKIRYEDDDNIVRIYANVDYLGNDHTLYGRR